MSTAARQGSSYKKPYSLDRDNQRADQLDATLTALAAPGVCAGGRVRHVSGLDVQVEANTVVYTAGVTHTFSAVTSHTVVATNARVWLYGLLTRTAATQANRADLDTYTLAITEVAEAGGAATAPTSLSIPLAIVVTDGAGVVNIDNAPPGKYAAGTLATQADLEALERKFRILLRMLVDEDFYLHPELESDYAVAVAETDY